MASNILDPAALTAQLVSLLPPSNNRLSSAHDGLAALVHTIFTTLGFRLIANDDTSPERTFQNNVLPEDWNTRGLTDHTLRYRHEQSSLEFLVKVIRLGQRTLINAIAIEVRCCHPCIYLLDVISERQVCVVGYIYQRFHFPLVLSL